MELSVIFIIIYENEGAVIEGNEKVLPYLGDTNMGELSDRIIGKLRNMTNEKFEQIKLTEAE